MAHSIRLVYSKDYAVDIRNHVFPTSKYSLIRERLLKESDLRTRIDFVGPAGGYAAKEADTVDIHYTTVTTGLKLYYGRSAG